MTYGVPYSFVPGTKAKADEVNANFIDILNKIEDTNSRIDDANTKSSQELKETKEELNAEISKKADLNFSNIGTNAKAMFSAKANNTDIDGKWVKKSLTIAQSTSISAGQTKNFSLSSYLPNDNNVYEVLLSTTLNVAGNYAYIFLSSSYVSNAAMCRADSAGMYAASSVTLPIGTNRTVSISSNSSQSGNATFELYAKAYRKVR